ncbi:transposon Tf2-9 polyprotein [Trichonephila clavipes]|nr:transposon Tf2-9 polyprotein [Trichonephila clavipes]
MPRTRQSDPLLTQTASEKFNLIDLIPMYDGGESLGIRRFLEKINDVANLGKWSNDEKVKLKLAGIAEEFFLSDPTHSHLTEYNDIARILIARFEKAVPLSTRLQLFSSCIQGSSESVQEFAARINKLGTQIFQSGNSAQNTAVRNANDQLIQSRFISGLRNDIRRFVLARDPINLDESINAALIEEQNVKLNQIANDERSGLSLSQTETLVISALTNKLQEINLRVERLQEASSVTVRKMGGVPFGRRRYIKNFAKRALPLTNLLRKDTPFEWTSEAQEAFDDIKKAILNPPVLALPDPDAELQITTDASSRGIGAV